MTTDVTSSGNTASRLKRRRTLFLLAAFVVLLATTSYLCLDIFVVQPIGAVPEGRTVVIWRLNTMKFVDSADAWCERQMGA